MQHSPHRGVGGVILTPLSPQRRALSVTSRRVPAHPSALLVSVGGEALVDRLTLSPRAEQKGEDSATVCVLLCRHTLASRVKGECGEWLECGVLPWKAGGSLQVGVVVCGVLLVVQGRRRPVDDARITATGELLSVTETFPAPPPEILTTHPPPLSDGELSSRSELLRLVPLPLRPEPKSPLVHPWYLQPTALLRALPSSPLCRPGASRCLGSPSTIHSPSIVSPQSTAAPLSPLSTRLTASPPAVHHLIPWNAAGERAPVPAPAPAPAQP
eukprot:Hpha_TRINITY_DN15011_c0_g2::TRINITY_DN15011_c0_g2_i1::g.126295::m.126295